MLKKNEIQFPDLKSIFAPKSVVVVGASERAGNLGGETVRRLNKFGFPGPVMAINRSGDTVDGVTAFASFAELPEVPELAIFAIPADGLINSVKDAIAKGVSAGVAYAGGLAEAGGDGVRLQEELTQLCREHNFILCGPNCVGTINTAHPLTATFATALHELDTLSKGVISMVSQSGGIATTLLTAAESAGFGLRHMISSGNEAILTFSDYLHAFAVDEGTQVIAGYLEGVRDGDRFIAALAEARRRNKPVVLIKAGATGASARAAQAHTGALVGEDRVFDAIFQEYGVIRVSSVEELLDTILLLSGTKNAHSIGGRGVGLVTFGGGNGVLGSDQCVQSGLSVPQISKAGTDKLKSLLVSVATAANPLDLTPTTAFRAESLALLPNALDVIAEEPEIDAIMFIVGSLAAKADEIAKVLEDFWRRCPKPVILSWPAPPNGIPERFAKLGIYTYLDPARGVRALSQIASRTDAISRQTASAEDNIALDWGPFVPDDASVITEDQCHDILRKAGLSVAAGQLATNSKQAIDAAVEMGFPVALKGISPKITHRADAGLVAIGLDAEQAVTDAYDRMSAIAKNANVELDGIYVQKMQSKSGELLVAAIRDPIFGVMITCGAGGGLTEILDDVVIARAPVDQKTAKSMIERLKVRGRIRDENGLVPIDAAADFVSRFSALAASAPWAEFTFEINPIMVGRDHATAVDGLLIVEKH